MTNLAAAKKLDWEAGDPAHAHTLPSRYYYDAGVFEAERERIFYKTWHAVGHVNELKEPGDFLTHEIFDQSVIVVRGRDGQARAFHNVCQHRGNRLLQQRRGKLGTVIRCGYHSWCYDFAGDLRNAPRSERLTDFDKSQYGLKPVRLETLGGFHFVNLDPNAQSLAKLAPGAEAEMRRFLPDLDRMQLIDEIDVVVPANWKVIMDNSIEGYHFDLSGPVHKTISKLTDFKQYSLTAHGNWWTYMAPPKPGLNSAYGEIPRGRGLADRLVLQHRRLAQHDLLLLPLHRHGGHLPDDPAGAGEVAAALRLLPAGTAHAQGHGSLHPLDERGAGARGYPAQRHDPEGAALLRL